MIIPYAKIEHIYKNIVQNEHFVRISSFEGNIHNFSVTVCFGEKVTCKNGEKCSLYLVLSGSHDREVSYNVYWDTKFEETPDWFQELYHEAKRINERYFRIKRIVETK
jgi:hypothetical protein